MIVHVIAFATAGEALGAQSVSLELADGAHTGDLGVALIARSPALESVWPRLAVAVDGEIVQGDVRLADGVEVALLPPVSGGSGTGDTGSRRGLPWAVDSMQRDDER